MATVVNRSCVWSSLIYISMQQKTFILALTFCLIAIVVFVIGVYLLLSTRTPAPVYTELPAGTEATSTPNAVVADSSYIKLVTPEGEVLIRDPRERTGITPMGGGVYTLTSVENISETNFGVVFNDSDGSFAVGLETEPLGETRRQAEQYLLSLTGVTEAELCKLNVYVGTTGRINQFYSGKNLGLSFCPNSVQLP